MQSSGKIRRIGCLGLSANPPHFGHVRSARLALQSLLVDEVWLIPVFIHPFAKPDFAPWHHRLAMTRLLEEPGIAVSTVEGERGRVSYTDETVAILQAQFPEHDFFWIVGSDVLQAQGYTQWHNWEILRNMIRFIVVERPGYPMYHASRFGEFIFIAEKFHRSLQEDISSTIVREYIRQGKDITSLAGREILCYISQHVLYQSPKEENKQ